MFDPIGPDHLHAVLSLNNAFELETSRLDIDDVKDLVEQAFWTAQIKDGRDAFLIALDEKAESDSLNYRWFKHHYNHFIYIDRIVVAPYARRQGIAKAMYTELFRKAWDSGYVVVTSEVNHKPSNDRSDALHHSLGFEKVGEAELPSGKTVHYLAKKLYDEFG